MKHPLLMTTIVFLGTLTAGCGHGTLSDFSFTPPEGWEFRDPLPGMKFKAAIGPARAGFASNINVVDEAFNGSLAAYAEGNLTAIQKAFKNFRLLKQETFTTTNGEPAVRMVTENEQNGRQLRQTFYFFGKGNTKFVVTCTTLAEGGEKLDPVFEASMKTFRFDPK